MFFVIVALIVVVFISNGVRIVRPYEKGVVERLGSYNRTVGSGLRLILPIIDGMNKGERREQVVDVPPQQGITKGNVAV